MRLCWVREGVLLKGVFAILVGFLALFSINATHAAEIPSNPRYGGTLISVLPADPPTLATWLSSSFLPRMVAPQIVEGLLEFDSALTPKPLLASSWKVSSDGREYVFNLRRDVKFHDGQPFTADDVVFSVQEVWLKYQSEARSRWKNVGLTVEKVDDYTVIFRLGKTYAYTLNYLSSHFGPIIPKHLFAGTDISSNPYNYKPVGTGPFKFKSYVKGSYVELERNPDYWDKDEYGNRLPYLDRLVMQIIPDPTARMFSMSRGDVDYQSYPGFPVESVKPLRKFGYEVVAEPNAGGARIERVFMNMRKGPLADIRVRKALFYALDREEIVRKAAYGYGVVSVGPFHQKSPPYEAFFSSDLPHYEYSPQKAAALLDEAGYLARANGVRFRLNLTINRALSIDGSVADLMRDYFKAVGIELSIQRVDEATRLSTAGRREFDLTMLGGTTSGPTPDAVSQYWLSDLLNSSGGWENIGGNNDKEIDSLLEQGTTEIDPVSRAKVWNTFQRKMIEEARELWIFDVLDVSVWNKEFVGLPQRTWGYYDALTRVWWSKGTPVGNGLASRAP